MPKLNLNNIKSNFETSQNDLYGNTLLRNNKEESNRNILKKMKNKIKYGNSKRGLLNNGSRKVVK